MKKGIYFALAYLGFICLTIGIGVYYATFDVPKDPMIEKAKQSEVSASFEEALKKDEERVREIRETKDPNKWEPSPTFVITAVSLGAIADIIIVILWARHENRKRALEADQNTKRKKSITDSNLFWWIIGMGIVRRKHEKLIVDWKYVALYIILGILLKVWLSKEIA
ncbi:hypothetical protein FZW96_19715 [Bacillus sp. BGMRC 2118]|nr:hypothetical protein FZW96_19715 [Bacillus sp. BGMRC 2118]